nr:MULTISPECIES: RHS repeat-associated core domain-containing protein [Paenibacillus]
MNNSTTIAYDVWGDQKEAIDTYGNLHVSETNIKERRDINYFIAAEDVAAYRANPSQTDNKSNYVERDYDPRGKLETVRVFSNWPDRTKSVTESFEYDIAGNLIGYIDPNSNFNDEGVTTRFTYDSLNQLTSVKDALGQLTKYYYDLNGDITKITVQGNETDTPKVLTTKTYNEVGLISEKIDSSGEVESYMYNQMGLLNNVKDRNKTVFEYSYDEQNRNIAQVAKRTGYTEQSKELIIGQRDILHDEIRLDANAMLTGKDFLNRITSLEIIGSTKMYLSYDKSSRITSIKSLYYNGKSFTTNYQYDRLRLDKVQIDGLSPVYQENSVNVRYSYYPDGKIDSIIYPPLTDGSVLKTEYEYDSLNRIKKMTNTKGEVILSSTTYTYDNNGNILISEETVKDHRTKKNHYTYDKLNRLIGIERADGSQRSFSYDTMGNRIILSDSMDKPMNLSGVTYTFSLDGKLRTVDSGSNKVIISYDANGMRKRKVSYPYGMNSKSYEYRYNLNNEVIAEVNNDGILLTSYVRGDRLLVKKDIKADKDYYYLYNGHGDVIQIVDTSGNIVNSYEYDEWGNITNQTEGIANSFKYAGEIYDEETGLYYLRARYYDPSMGRFISEDSYEGQITNPLSLNLYTYTHNNPLKYIDPSGHKVWLIHGTFSKPSTWTDDFQTYVGEIFDEEVENVKWSGGNSTNDRQEAADEWV